MCCNNYLSAFFKPSQCVYYKVEYELIVKVTPTLQKSEGFRVKASEGEVVVLYFKPSATQNLKSSGFPEMATYETTVSRYEIKYRCKDNQNCRNDDSSNNVKARQFSFSYHQLLSTILFIAEPI